jgi:hypothetical protein
MQQPILLSSPTKQRAPSSLFSVVPAGCSTECTANRALQQPSRSFSTPLVACRRSSARCAAPSATPSKPVVRNPCCPCCYYIFIFVLGRMLNCCVCLIAAIRQCQPSCTRVRYMAGRANNMHAQLRSDPVQVDCFIVYDTYDLVDVRQCIYMWMCVICFVYTRW